MSRTPVSPCSYPAVQGFSTDVCEAIGVAFVMESIYNHKEIMREIELIHIRRRKWYLTTENGKREQKAREYRAKRRAELLRKTGSPYPNGDRYPGGKTNILNNTWHLLH